MLVHLYLAWCWFAFGIGGGTILGLFFHKEAWLGGYSSWRRRLLRLGHISFFGLGLLNLCFYFTTASLGTAHSLSLTVSSYGLLTGAISMPLVCFLSAFKKTFRDLFFIPVLSTLTGVLALIFTLLFRS